MMGHRDIYRHRSPAAPDDAQLAHGIDTGIAHCAETLFKPEGWALD